MSILFLRHNLAKETRNLRENDMKFELQIFLAIIIMGLLVKRVDWRGQFFLALFLILWITYNRNR